MIARWVGLRTWGCGLCLQVVGRIRRGGGGAALRLDGAVIATASAAVVGADGPDRSVRQRPLWSGQSERWQSAQQ
jgi:hypothetical protein